MCPIAARRSLSPDIISNKVQLIFDNLPTALEQARAGNVRALGVTSPQRWPGVPDIPAIAETVPGFESVGFYGISAPRALRRRSSIPSNKAVNEALQDPKLVAKLTEIGGIPKPMTPAEFRQADHGRNREMAQGRRIRRGFGGLGSSHHRRSGQSPHHALPDRWPACKRTPHRCRAAPPAAPAAGPVAQWLEPAAHNGLVAGSSPAGPTSKSMA